MLKEYDYNYWQDAKTGFLDFIEKQHLTKSVLVHYRGVLDHLIYYAAATGCTAYTPELGKDFIDFEEKCANRTAGVRKLHRIVTRRFCEYMDGKKFVPVHPHRGHLCPSQFRPVFEKFMSQLEREGLATVTLKEYKALCIKMLQDFSVQGIKNWSEVCAKNLTTAFENSNDRVHFATYARRLFKFLVKNEVIKFDYSGILPSIPHCQKVPSVYTETEIAALLNGIDRQTSMGKRDYAIVLLALRLGLRASDIGHLTFDNINFDTNMLEFDQHKTGATQALTLLPEVEDALRDYIDSRCAKVETEQIFLTYRNLPLSSHSISGIVNKCFERANIDCGDRHHGSHALRMTLATELVSEGVPYRAVQKILGHESPDSLSHYVKFDVKSLRTCALEVPVPQGQLAAYLNLGGATLL